MTPLLLLRSQRGVTGIMATFLLIPLIAMAGLGIDLGRMFVVRAELVKAVDGGALAGARVLPSGEVIAEDGQMGGYWRLDTQYDGQLGVGVLGDQPNDFKFQYVGAVYRDLESGYNEYVGQGSGWVFIPDDDELGSRVMPPFAGPGNGGWTRKGGPILTLREKDIHIFILPTGVRPGAVLEVDQRPVVTRGTHQLGRDRRADGQPAAKCSFAPQDPFPETRGRRIMCVEHRGIVPVSTARRWISEGSAYGSIEDPFHHRDHVLLG